MADTKPVRLTSDHMRSWQTILSHIDNILQYLEVVDESFQECLRKCKVTDLEMKIHSDFVSGHIGIVQHHLEYLRKEVGKPFIVVADSKQ